MTPVAEFVAGFVLGAPLGVLAFWWLLRWDHRRGPDDWRL